MPKRLILAILLVALLVGCGTRKARPTEDSDMAVEAFNVADRLIAHYTQREFDSMRSLCTEEGYATIEAGLRKFDKAKIEAHPLWVTIKPDGRVLLRLDWQGEWSFTRDENKQDVNRSGIAEFVLSGKPLKLQSPGPESLFTEPDEAERLGNPSSTK